MPATDCPSCGKFVYLHRPRLRNLRHAMRTTEQPLIATEDTPVCVIDGDAAVRDSLATLISLCGRTVLAFATGSECLAAARGQPLGCVVCAAQLPDTSALALFQALRDSHPAARFALLLSRTDPTAADDARSRGVHAVFEKPLGHRRLITLLQTGQPA